MKKRKLAKFSICASIISIAILLAVMLPSKMTIDAGGILSVDIARANPDPGWVTPTSHTANGWADPTYAYDDETTLYASYTVQAVWSPYLELYVTAIDCDKVQAYCSRQNAQVTDQEVDVYYSGAWHNIYSGAPQVDAYYEYAIGSTQSVTGMRFRFNSSKSGRRAGVNDADFWEVTACSPDISNSPSTHNFGVVSESANYTTGLTNFTVTNNSGGAVDISIQGTDMTGGTTWTLSDTATAGTNTYGLKCGTNTEGTYGTIVKKNSPYNDLVTGLADSGTEDWGLQFFAPTSMDDGAEKTCTVTLTATCQ